MSDPAGLVNRRFLLLVSGEALSIIGDQLTRIAAIWLILEIASNPAAVGFWLAAGATAVTPGPTRGRCFLQMPLR